MACIVHLNVKLKVTELMSPKTGRYSSCLVLCTLNKLPSFLTRCLTICFPFYRLPIFMTGSKVRLSRASSSRVQYFITRPSDVEVTEGTPLVELQCQVGNLMGQVQWSKDGFLLGMIFLLFFSISLAAEKTFIDLFIPFIYSCPSVCPSFTMT